ncbi:MAG: 50S ribosomal protein L21e [Nanobdellota archaeon]
MVKRIGTFGSKTRHKLQKSRRQKGKLPLSRYFQQFDEGDRVVLKAEPAVKRGMYFPRFHGKVGTILQKRGFCYEVRIKDFNKQKTVIVHPVHLTRS